MLPFFLKRNLEKIFINDSEIIKRLDKRRESRNIYDKDLLGRPVKCLDLSNKEEIIPDGRLRIDKGSARFECFFHQGNKNSNSKLYILLSAARTARGGRKRAIPQFNRWSWYSNVEDHWLSIEDPMYFNNDEILVGWFYGTAEENYRQYLADIAEYFSSKLGVNRSNVIFYGSSAGGPAALHAAKLFRGGVGVSINGQYNFEYDRFDVTDFKTKLGIDLKKDDPFERNNVASWLQDKNSTYLVIGNIRSKWDRIDHLRYISKKLNSNFEIGLNIYDNYIVWLYEANGYLGSPHSSFEDKNFFYAIDFLANKLAHHESLSEFKELYLLFNEFWFDKYESEKRLLIKSNLKENRLLFAVQNLEIDANEDRFFNYKIPLKLDRNIKYHIAIEADHEKSNSLTFTVGVFNWRKKEFIVRSDILLNKEQIKLEFLIDHDDDRNQLLIFPGLHGQCVNKKLFIKKLDIFI